MRSVKSIFGMIGTLFAIAYCGGLVFYFLNLSGSMQEVQNIGLGPTVMGLGGLGVLFCIVLIVQLIRFILKTRSRGGDGPGAADGGKDKGGFDAEAAFNRYMAQRAADGDAAAPMAPPTTSSFNNSGAPRPQGFGRKKT